VHEAGGERIHELLGGGSETVELQVHRDLCADQVAKTVQHVSAPSARVAAELPAFADQPEGRAHILQSQSCGIRHGTPMICIASPDETAILVVGYADAIDVFTVIAGGHGRNHHAWSVRG
jgi:hypothetical protein